jgi:hypothetical protein
MIILTYSLHNFQFMMILLLYGYFSTPMHNKLYVCIYKILYYGRFD